MSANVRLYQTGPFEVVAVANTGGASIPVGHAVKLASFPAGATPADVYFKVDAAGTADEVLGTVSAQNNPLNPPITPTAYGRIVLDNSVYRLCMMSAAGSKGDKIKVKTSDGRFAPIAMGETPYAELVENATTGELAWACTSIFTS